MTDYQIYSIKKEIKELNKKGLLRGDVKKKVEEDFFRLQTSVKEKEIQKYKHQIQSTIVSVKYSHLD